MRSRAPKSSPSDTRTHTHTYTQRVRERERRERGRERQSRQYKTFNIKREFQAESAGLARPTVAAG